MSVFYGDLVHYESLLLSQLNRKPLCLAWACWSSCTRGLASNLSLLQHP